MSSESSSLDSYGEAQRRKSEKRGRPSGDQESMKRVGDKARPPRSAEEDELEHFYSNAFANDMQTLQRLSGAGSGQYGSNSAARRTSDKRWEGRAGSLKRKKSQLLGQEQVPQKNEVIQTITNNLLDDFEDHFEWNRPRAPRKGSKADAAAF